MGTNSRRSSPMQIWRGRAIFCSGSCNISCHCASQPTVRGMPNSTVNCSGLKPMASFVGEGDALQIESDIDFRVPAGDREHLVRNPLDDAGAQIVVLVHAVPEAHQFALAF